MATDENSEVDLAVELLTQLHTGFEDSLAPGVDIKRPRTRGECPTVRPCPWVSCRYHLLLRVSPRGSIRINEAGFFGSVPTRRRGEKRTMHPTEMRSGSEGERKLINSAVRDLFDRQETCALDVAEDGEHPWREVGELLSATEERARQIGTGAMQTVETTLMRFRRTVETLKIGDFR